MPAEHTMLVGISGIDASGKGYVAEKVAKKLESSSLRIALINIDGWLNLPSVRFSEKDPGVHFYNEALRLDEAFERLIGPLRQNRQIDITADFVDEKATEFRPYRYTFQNIDIIIVEGIFLFKRSHAPLFDLRVWIECSFETALSRAIQRNQEGLSPSETIQAYERIYFPAQKRHFEVDDPRSAVHIFLAND